MLPRDRDWIEAQFKDLRREVVKVQVDISALKVKAGMFGLVGGAIPVAVSLAVYLVTKGWGG